MRRLLPSVLFVVGLAPIVAISAQQASPAPTAEQVFKNIKVFNGVPASDLIPAMEFMSASLKWPCQKCHDPKDFAAETKVKETSRQMVLLQRDINTKYFAGRLEVTCNSCHGGQEHPAGTPIPAGVTMRHERAEGAPKPDELMKRHIASVGKSAPMVVRTGTLTAPNDETHKLETLPLEYVQADGGKFRMVSGSRKVVSNGSQVVYGGNVMSDEPLSIFGRIGRAWRGDQAFAGLERLTVSGKDLVGKTKVLVVRGVRPATSSTEELYFDEKSGLLVRMVNIRRSTIGTVLMVVDYQNYKAIGGTKVPMKVVVTFADEQKWEMDFKSAKRAESIDETLFSN